MFAIRVIVGMGRGGRGWDGGGGTVGEGERGRDVVFLLEEEDGGPRE